MENIPSTISEEIPTMEMCKIRVAYPEESFYATTTCGEKGQGLASPVKGANPTWVQRQDVDW